MRLSPFLFMGIMVCALALMLSGCTKIESSKRGGHPGIRFGFVEKEDVPPALPEEQAMPDEQEQEPSADAVSSPIAEAEQIEEQEGQEPEPVIEAPSDAPPEDAQNETSGNASNVTGTNTTNETNATMQEPAVEQDVSSGNLTNSSEGQPPDDAPLGFEIRIDANRYYQSGAVRCHDSGLAQCVHIHIGPENCGAGCHFDPEVIMVPVGTTIEWGNHDTAAHQVVAWDGSFSSDPLERTVSVNGTYPAYAVSHFPHTFNTPGEYRYRGEEGSSLTGVVIVVTSLSS